MDVSLGSLMSRLFALRSWDSTGPTLDRRIRAGLNLALDRLAGDVPEALIPDEQHVALFPDVLSTDAAVDASAISYGNDKRLLYFSDSTGTTSIAASSKTTWRPTVTGEWDGVMHLEFTYGDGRVRRRQSREWFKKTIDSVIYYFVTLDRPLADLIPTDSDIPTFRIYQPEFFLMDDVMEVLEPARIYDSSRQQVWKMDTAGASRQDMVDFQGESKGRPYRCWRGRHFQLPAPTEAPEIVQVNLKRPKIVPDESVDEVTLEPPSASGGTPQPGNDPNDPNEPNVYDNQGNVVPMGLTTTVVSGVTLPDLPPDEADFKWSSSKSLREGTWAIRYTYVWGRRDDEWQQSPSIAPVGDQNHDGSFNLTWAYDATTQPSDVAVSTGVHDPVWESAPSPSTVINQKALDGSDGALLLSATNIDAMLGFGDSTYARFGRSGLRIRYYVAHRAKKSRGVGEFNGVETGEKFYLLCEVEPTYDHVQALSDAGKTIPPGILTDSGLIKSARVVWNGAQLYDYHRPLKHSTGYYAWKVFPHQDARYELDFRVLRLPPKYVDPQDTAPIQRDAVPALLELALHYISLDDGNDQTSAAAHLGRYQDLVRVFRERYTNPGGIVEPVPFTGYRSNNRYGTFGNTTD